MTVVLEMLIGAAIAVVVGLGLKLIIHWSDKRYKR